MTGSELQGVRFDPDVAMTIRLEFAKTNTKMQKYHNHPNFIHVNNFHNGVATDRGAGGMDQPMYPLYASSQQVSPTSPNYKAIGRNGAAFSYHREGVSTPVSLSAAAPSVYPMSVASQGGQVASLSATSPVALAATQPPPSSHILASYTGN